MPFDAHGTDGKGGAAAAGALSTVGALAGALPGAPAANAADEELTLEQRIGWAAAEFKKTKAERTEEADETKWPALDAKLAKLAEVITELEAQADAQAPPPAPAAAAPPAAAKPEPVLQTARFGEFKETWAHVGFTPEEVAEFHKGLQAMPWSELQEKLQARKTCKLM